MCMLTRRFGRIAGLLLILTSLAGCTRERPAPEPTATPAGLETSAVDTGLAQAPGEPVVEQETPTVEPTAIATPEPQRETMQYTVQPGDTVSTIAEKFGTASDNIRQLNFLVNDNIFVGQVLRVPYVEGATAEGLPAPPPEPYAYRVQPGDTLGSIAITFGVPVFDIVNANELADPNNLIVGQTLLIPGYVPAPDGAAPATAGTELLTHTVQPGESLSQIAETYGVSMQAIMDANGISEPDRIQEGQSLIIPGALTTGAPPAQAVVVHEVQTGESLLDIALRYGVDASAIIDANGLQDPNLIVPGQELVIPGVSPAAAATAQRIIHVVEAGEGLFDIAQRYGVSPNAIAEANNLEDPNMIKEGQELLIPAE